MLGLKLREEFRNRRLKGTAIELVNINKAGATQAAATDFLTITCPSTDTLKLLEATGPNHGRWDQGRDDCPLLVGKVRWVRCPCHAT